MQQQKNVLVAVLLTLGFFYAYMLFVQWMWPAKPRKPKPPEPPIVQLPMRELWASLPASLQGLAAQGSGAGLAGAGQLAAAVALADYSAAERPLAKAPAPPAPPKPAPPLVKEEPVPGEPHREITLGNDNADSRFNIKVVLTSHGAGVQRLVLNKFLEADRYGRPAGDPPPPMDLIPSNSQEPSTLLYHYPPSEDVHPDHPLDTLGKREWRLVSVKDGPNDPVQEAVFSTTLPGMGVNITKTYTLEPATYHLGLTLKFECTKPGKKPVPFRYQLTSGHGLPIEGVWYTTIYRNAMVGLSDPQRHVWRDLQTSQQIGYQEGGHEVLPVEDRFIRYAGIANQFFASVVVVDDHQDEGIKQNFIAWARPTVEGRPNDAKPFLDDVAMRLVSQQVDLQPGVPVVHKYVFYNGPVKVRLLAHLEGVKAVSPALVDRYMQESQLGLNTLTDVGNLPSVLSGWSNLLISCTNLMHGLMFYLHKFVMPWSYGLCIILLTLLVRGAMFPFSRRQALASVKMQEKMAELQPDIKKLEEKYKHDRLELQRAKQELMLKRGVNPLAMVGSCWMVLAQMPIFLGLYYSLQESIHFRLARFLWMPNLAAPDMLIWWSERIPFISTPESQGQGLAGMFYLGPYFNLLPIIAVTFMILQQKLLTPPPTDEQQEMQQKTMKYMMIFFGIMFYKVAAGLCLYFIVSSAWGLAERKLFLPKKASTSSPPAQGRSGPGGRPARTKPRSPKEDGNGTFRKVREMWQEVLKEARKK